MKGLRTRVNRHMRVVEDEGVRALSERDREIYEKVQKVHIYCKLALEFGGRIRTQKIQLHANWRKMILPVLFEVAFENKEKITKKIKALCY